MHVRRDVCREDENWKRNDKLQLTKTSYMNKDNIKQIIVALFRDNVNAYPEHYSDSVVEGVETAMQVAKGYWDNRTEDEFERDEKAGVTAQDYENWVVDELAQLKKAEA